MAWNSIWEAVHGAVSHCFWLVMRIIYEKTFIFAVQKLK